MIRKPLLIAITILGAPQLAHAGDAKCLWNVLTPQTQNEVVTAYVSQGRRAALTILSEAGRAASGAMLGCAQTMQTRSQGESGGEAAATAISGYALQESSRILLGRRGVSLDRLNTGWDGLAPDERAFARWAFAPGMSSDENADQAATIFGKAAGLAGWTEADGIETLTVMIDHYMGRAMREAGEQRF